MCILHIRLKIIVLIIGQLCISISQNSLYLYSNNLSSTHITLPNFSCILVLVYSQKNSVVRNFGGALPSVLDYYRIRRNSDFGKSHSRIR
jgi:hypothetical protein